MKWVSVFLIILAGGVLSGWGFYGHRTINRIAVFTLPPEMMVFYKKHIRYLEESAVNPDRRRYAVVEEAPRHYIDLDHYGDSARTLPVYWQAAVARYTEDTLQAYGILPWHLTVMYYRLREAFRVGDPDRILKLSAELGHYVADAHVPLHTTENYNGQLTGQYGIHGLWESRLPELHSEGYDFFTGTAQYLPDVQAAAWAIVWDSHVLVDSVLRLEKQLAAQFGERRYAFEVKGRQTVKVYARGYARAYHEQLRGMVERRMREAIRITGSMWYTAWVDAGQPDLRRFLDYTPTEEELAQRRQEIAQWKLGQLKTREHETDD